MTPYFSGEITLGNIFATTAFLAAAAFAWRDLNWRVRNLETWKEGHLHTAEEALRNITMLREAVVGIQKIAEGQDKRIEMLEERRDWRTQ